jgi:hypothetical protein
VTIETTERLRATNKVGALAALAYDYPLINFFSLGVYRERIRF